MKNIRILIGKLQIPKSFNLTFICIWLPCLSMLHQIQEANKVALNVRQVVVLSEY